MARHTSYADIRSAIYRDMELEAERKNRAPEDKFDVKLMEQGTKWFQEGLELEKAPEELKHNKNFINGFNRAKRLHEIALYQYDLGVQYANRGVEFDQIPDKDRENPNVVRGYEDTRSNKRSK